MEGQPGQGKDFRSPAKQDKGNHRTQRREGSEGGAEDINGIFN